MRSYLEATLSRTEFTPLWHLAHLVYTFHRTRDDSDLHHARMDEVLHHHDVIGCKGQTLARTMGGGEYSLVVDHGAADGWYFLSLAGKELGVGTAEGREGLKRFGKCV